MADETTITTVEKPIEGPPPPPPPTPLNPPRVYFSLGDRVPPRIVFTKEEADALDPKLWITLPPVDEPQPKSDTPEWPKLVYNVNSPPVVVGSAEAFAALGTEYRVYEIPQAILDVLQPPVTEPPA